ncbi:hypothetical protein [Streptomyces sp. SID14515]|uniref:hypothetical protein n=1 Tax=Streptomyces sp. SID14515 TaxID=2706074 RepID=UPI0013C68196|nr:hypothetical protein [Streptomyces sp. SID14515]NEB40176.1 hypothetical protein [Streptomyces sp. SID14515]
MRRLTAGLMTLVSTAAVIGTTLVAPSAAVAANTWQSHDKNCTTITIEDQSIGSVCAEVQKRVTSAGAVNGYRARTTVSPTAGNWFKPDVYVWTTDGSLGELCPGGCAQQTSDWTSPWSSVKTVPGSYRVRGEHNRGSYDVSASWSNWSQLAEKCATYAGAGEVCVRRHERSHRGVLQERGQIAVHPATGKWIEPRTVRVGTVNDGTTTATGRDLCDPSCTRRSANWSATVSGNLVGPSSTFEGFAAASFALPSGTVKTLKASYS